MKKGTGINDDLNGTERPVAFPIKDMNETVAEVVHSLAKWKRLTLGLLEIEPGYGLYTDMNAIRPDEELGNLHSLYVDQWDWEKRIRLEDRNLDYLKDTVKNIWQVIYGAGMMIKEKFPELNDDRFPDFPKELKFFHAEELLDMYPDLPPKERETAILQEYPAIFIITIGQINS